MKKIRTTTIQLWNTDTNVNTTSWLLSAFLGISGNDTELINDVPKELRLDKQYNLSNDDLFVFSQQKKRLDSLQGKINFAITTLPLQSFSLNNKKDLEFSMLVDKIRKTYPSINLLIKADTNRYRKIKTYLDKNNEEYKEFENNPFVSLDILLYLEEKSLVSVNPELKKLKKIIDDLVKNKKINLDNLSINKLNEKENFNTMNFSFYAPPSGGKSTTARIFASLLRLNNQETELVDEVPKEMVWNEQFDRLSDQMFIFSQQNRKLSNFQGKYKFTVTDSPLDIQHLYVKKNKMPSDFHNLIDFYHNQYKTVDIWLNRKHKYQQVGRVQNEEESNQIGKEIKDFMKESHKTKKLYEFETTPLVAFKILKEFDGVFYKLSKDMEVLVKEIEKQTLKPEYQSMGI